MNKKLIAAAVSAAVVAPVAAYGDVTVYGRINNALDIDDISSKPDADGSTDISGVSSRFGVKYSQDMGNGLTASGKYEFSTSTDNEGGINDGRVAKVGISGAFGSVAVGNQWSAYFDTFGTLVSPTYTLGYYLYSSVGGAPFRASNTIKYSNTYGPLYLELDVRFNGSNEDSAAGEKIRGDGIGLGLSFAVNDNLTIAAAFDNETGGDRAGVAGVDARVVRVTHDYNAGGTEETNPALTVIRYDRDTGKPESDPSTIAAVGTVITTGPGFVEGAGRVVDEAVEAVAAVPADEAPDTDRVGVAAKYAFGGGYWASLGWQNYTVDDDERTAKNDETDVDTIILYVGGNFSEKTNWLVGRSTASDGDDAANTDDSTQLTWGVYHNIGGGMKLYYEATTLESENKEWDGSAHLLGMRVDF